MLRCLCSRVISFFSGLIKFELLIARKEEALEMLIYSGDVKLIRYKKCTCFVFSTGASGKLFGVKYRIVERNDTIVYGTDTIG